MRRKVKNEDFRPLNLTQPTSVNSSCHKGFQRNAFLLKNGFLLLHIYIRAFTGVPKARPRSSALRTRGPSGRRLDVRLLGFQNELPHKNYLDSKFYIKYFSIN